MEANRTLGPVSDLEHHLPSDWWRTLFNSMYLKTDGDIVENRAATSHEVDEIISLTGIEPNDHILDLCCGQGRHSIELARRGFTHITGLDRSRYLIRLARQRARKEKRTITYREGDARRIRLHDKKFHTVLIMGNSFGYFEHLEDDLSVLKSCRRVLLSGGTLLIDVTNGDWMRENFDKRSWEWIDQDHLVCRERSLSADQTRLISREVVTHVDRGVIIDQFYAERLYNPKDLKDLLEKAGFSSVRFHGEMIGSSTRGQDLGMMANRLIVTAAAPVSSPGGTARKIPFPKITVIMGDPRLPDKVKKNGQYNEEDLETISRLKKALSELGEYEFSYIDNHTSLLSTIKTERPQFVFNLCDEGFNNNARLELNIPAYLEVLGIPYSGASPSGLAICYNKSLVRALAETIDIPTPLETYYSPGDQSATIPATFPALVKPNFGDGSIGITMEALVHTSVELIEYINILKSQFPENPFLIQEFLTGPEYSLAIIGNNGNNRTFLPILEVDYSELPEELPRILGYESKWLPESAYWKYIQYKQAHLSEDKIRLLQDYSLKLFERLECRDYARFDFRADSSGIIKLLEVNPNPGWCWDGKLNYMAGFAGLRYAQMLELIIRAAQERVCNYENTSQIRQKYSGP